MLNNEKIKLMTKLSLYEEKEKKNNMRIHNFFKHDYIIYNLVKSGVYLLLSFAIIALLAFLYFVEDIVENIAVTDFAKLGSMLLILFLASLSLYMILAYFVYDSRYDRAKRNLKAYHSGLKRLNRAYELSERAESRKED